MSLLVRQKDLVAKREMNGWVISVELRGERVAFVAVKGNRKEVLFYRDEVEQAA